MYCKTWNSHNHWDELDDLVPKSCLILIFRLLVLSFYSQLSSDLTKVPKRLQISSVLWSPLGMYFLWDTWSGDFRRGCGKHWHYEGRSSHGTFLTIEAKKEASELIRIHPTDCIRSSVTTWREVKLKIKLLT